MPTVRQVSFVLPAYNEADLIAGTIQALDTAARECGLPSYEIIVADDASDDDTARIAAENGATVVPCSNRQIAATRNAGAAAATGDLLVFVDADTVVPAETVAAMLREVGAGAVAGGSRCWFDEPIPRWVRWIGPYLLEAYARARLTPGAFLFCTREAFDAVGGYDTKLFGGEEVILSRALDAYAKTQGQRFVVLQEKVITSGRKVRTYSALELFWILLTGILRRGKSRKGLEAWYGQRRVDSGTAEQKTAEDH